MRRKTSGCICLFAIALCILQPALNPVCYAQEARGGEAIDAGGDAGEPVSESGGGGGGGSGVWKWVVGVTAVVVAGLGGFVLADKSEENKDDAEKAAAEAAASAEAAEAAAAPAAAEGPKTKVYITGTFVGNNTSYNGGGSFAPTLVFAVETATYPGGVVDYVSSDGVTGLTGLGGSYSQSSESSLLILVDDGFYLGTITLVNSTTIDLYNGEGTFRLRGQGSARIFVMPLE